MNSKKIWKTGRIVILISIVAIIGLSALGCVRGLSPIGWSGGAVADGKIFVGSREGKLVSVNLQMNNEILDGEVLKAGSQPGLFGCSPIYGSSGCGGGSSAVAIYGTPAFTDDLVYIAGYN
ncbi:MAG: hypothetical protein MUO19_06635, partial [Dehalococcoidales bacterium]|nr:hypothetical protein [Dehalococcoidales bacterium]